MYTTKKPNPIRTIQERGDKHEEENKGKGQKQEMKKHAAKGGKKTARR